MDRDPYEVLGVAKTATQDEIKNVYRKLAKAHHPDLNPGKKEAERKFKEIATAYEQVGTPEARAKFDRGEAEQTEQARTARSGPSYYETQREGGRYTSDLGGGFGGMGDDLFESIFRQAREPRQQASGEDQLYRMDVDFRDAILGAEKEITLPSGKKLKVQIPPGIENNQRLRFRGQGGPGIGKGPPGDAYVEIHVTPSKEFRRQAMNLESDLSVSLDEALLGGEVRVPTVDGTVMLRIPPYSNTGTKLRVRGKGVADPKGNSRGDQIVTLKVMLPKTPDPELERAIRQWADSHRDDPRERSA